MHTADHVTIVSPVPVLPPAMNNPGGLLLSDKVQEESVVFFVASFSGAGGGGGGGDGGGGVENLKLGLAGFHDGRVLSRMLPLAVVAPDRVASITEMVPTLVVPVSVPNVPLREPPP